MDSTRLGPRHNGQGKSRINNHDLKSPPYSPDAEMALLGSILLDNAVVGQIDDIEPEHFYKPATGRFSPRSVNSSTAGFLRTR